MTDHLDDAQAVAWAAAHDHGHDYSSLLEGVRTSFSAAATHSHLFATGAAGLNELYLDSLPALRQLHNCSACRNFIRLYGGLVGITEGGETVPAMWNPEAVPAFYRPAFSALRDAVKKARVTSLFLTKRTVWGQPVTGKWQHMSAAPPVGLVYRERALTALQATAAARENFKTVATALAEFSVAMLDQALRLLEADALARSEKFIGPVKWLRALHDRPKGQRGENVLWRAIAAAPEGYCHPKASVIGPLLNDIAAGLPFAEIKARFDAKMAPLRYQRPQAAPTASNIKAAEALVEKLAIAPALERRFARIEDLQTIWKPVAEQPPAPTGGVFGHLRPKKSAGEVRPIELPAVTMTWEKFARTVLPVSQKLEITVPSRGSFIALTTTVHADAPPILKWDHEVERNPVAWYVYPNGSPAHQWGLTAGTWAKITALALMPTMWGSRPMPFISEGVVAIIEGAVDSHDGGNALFPECLKDDLHGVRATIEAYSCSARLAGRETASACGYDIRKSSANCVLRSFSKGSWSTYRIDRWD
jgi:hypothetical protein